MQYTRPQRKRLALVLLGTLWAVLIVMFWMSTSISWRSVPEWRNRNGGIKETNIGMLDVLRIIERDVSPTGQRGPQHGTSWQWQPLRLIVTGLASVLTTLLLGLLYQRFIRAGRLDGRFCDECGYDLTGSPSAVCPECGHARLSGDSRGD